MSQPYSSYGRDSIYNRNESPQRAKLNTQARHRARAPARTHEDAEPVLTTTAQYTRPHQSLHYSHARHDTNWEPPDQLSTAPAPNSPQHIRRVSQARQSHRLAATSPSMSQLLIPGPLPYHRTSPFRAIKSPPAMESMSGTGSITSRSYQQHHLRSVVVSSPGFSHTGRSSPGNITSHSVHPTRLLFSSPQPAQPAAFSANDLTPQSPSPFPPQLSHHAALTRRSRNPLRSRLGPLRCNTSPDLRPALSTPAMTDTLSPSDRFNLENLHTNYQPTTRVSASSASQSPPPFPFDHVTALTTSELAALRCGSVLPIKHELRPGLSRQHVTSNLSSGTTPVLASVAVLRTCVAGAAHVDDEIHLTRAISGFTLRIRTNEADEMPAPGLNLGGPMNSARVHQTPALGDSPPPAITALTTSTTVAAAETTTTITAAVASATPGTSPLRTPTGTNSSTRELPPRPGLPSQFETITTTSWRFSLSNNAQHLNLTAPSAVPTVFSTTPRSLEQQQSPRSRPSVLNQGYKARLASPQPLSPQGSRPGTDVMKLPTSFAPRINSPPITSPFAAQLSANTRPVGVVRKTANDRFTAKPMQHHLPRPLSGTDDLVAESPNHSLFAKTPPQSPTFDPAPDPQQDLYPLNLNPSTRSSSVAPTTVRGSLSLATNASRPLLSNRTITSNETAHSQPGSLGGTTGLFPDTSALSSTEQNLPSDLLTSTQPLDHLIITASLSQAPSQIDLLSTEASDPKLPDPLRNRPLRRSLDDHFTGRSKHRRDRDNRLNLSLDSNYLRADSHPHARDRDRHYTDLAPRPFADHNGMQPPFPFSVGLSRFSSNPSESVVSSISQPSTSVLPAGPTSSFAGPTLQSYLTLPGISSDLTIPYRSTHEINTTFVNFTQQLNQHSSTPGHPTLADTVAPPIALASVLINDVSLRAEDNPKMLLASLIDLKRRSNAVVNLAQNHPTNHPVSILDQITSIDDVSRLQPLLFQVANRPVQKSDCETIVDCNFAPKGVTSPRDPSSPESLLARNTAQFLASYNPSTRSSPHNTEVTSESRASLDQISLSSPHFLAPGSLMNYISLHQDTSATANDREGGMFVSARTMLRPRTSYPSGTFLRNHVQGESLNTSRDEEGFVPSGLSMGRTSQPSSALLSPQQLHPPAGVEDHPVHNIAPLSTALILKTGPSSARAAHRTHPADALYYSSESKPHNNPVKPAPNSTLASRSTRLTALPSLYGIIPSNFPRAGVTTRQTSTLASALSPTLHPRRILSSQNHSTYLSNIDAKPHQHHYQRAISLYYPVDSLSDDYYSSPLDWCKATNIVALGVTNTIKIFNITASAATASIRVPNQLISGGSWHSSQLRTTQLSRTRSFYTTKLTSGNLSSNLATGRSYDPIQRCISYERPHRMFPMADPRLTFHRYDPEGRIASHRQQIIEQTPYSISSLVCCGANKIATGTRSGDVFLFDIETEKVTQAYLGQHVTRISTLSFCNSQDITAQSTEPTANHPTNSCKQYIAPGRASTLSTTSHSATSSSYLHQLPDFDRRLEPDLDFPQAFHPNPQRTSSSSIPQDMGQASQRRRQPAVVNSSTFQQSLHLLASGGEDGIIKIYDLRLPRPITSIHGQHTREVTGLSWSEDGTQLASGGNDRLVALWSLYGQRRLYRHHKAAIRCLAWSPFEPHLLASGGGSSDRTICLWDTRYNFDQTRDCFGPILESNEGAETSPSALVAQTNTSNQVCNLVWGRRYNEIIAALGYTDNLINFYHVPNLEPVSEVGPDRVIDSVPVEQDDWFGFFDGEAILPLPVRSPVPHTFNSIAGFNHRPLHIALSPRGDYLAIASADLFLRLVQVAKEE